MENIINYYRKQGMTYKQISNKLEISTKTIWKILSSQNIVKKHNKTTFHDFFEKIDSEEKAYFLGLLMADGSVSSIRNTITISLKKEDLHIIETFRSILKNNNIITKTKNNYRLVVYSKKMVNDLIKLGCVDRKTYTNSQFPLISIDMINHFIRGYFDGDGHIGMCESYSKHKNYKRINYTFYILLQENYKNYVKNFFKNEYNVDLAEYIKKECSNNLFILKTGQKEKLEMIYSSLYKNASLFLIRKKEIWDKIIKNISHI